MKFMEDRILRDGQVRPGNILKVDSFLNHQLDISLLNEVGKAFYERFKDKGVTRILTVEASGIAIACMTANSVVHSFTYGIDNTVTLSKKFLGPDDKVLIVDDFLANGKAVNGLLDICRQAGAEVVGIGIAIEKGFQRGGDDLRERGYDLLSLAVVDEMSDTDIVFRRED